MTHVQFRTTQQPLRVASRRRFAVGILAAAAIAAPAAGLLAGSGAPSFAGRPGYVEVSATGTSMLTTASVRGTCLTAASECI
jgi:hypothetical protein